MEIKIAVAVISSLALGVAGIGGVLLYKYLKEANISKKEKSELSSGIQDSKTETIKSFRNENSISKSTPLTKDKGRKKSKIRSVKKSRNPSRKLHRIFT